MNEQELIEVFSACTEAIEQEGRTLDECLDKYPQYRAELIDLLEVATQTRAVPTAVPAAEFSAEARGRLLAKLPPRRAANEEMTPAPMAARTAVTQRARSLWQAFTERWPWPVQPSLAVGSVLLLLLLLLIGNSLAPFGQSTEIAQDDPPAQTASSLIAAESEAQPATDAAAEDNQEATSAVTASNDTNSTFIPIVSSVLTLTPELAGVEEVQGLVEVQAEDGSWTAVQGSVALAVGQRLRTADLSQATLTFYDGSQATLDANSELSIDQLNALRPTDGFRTVVLTQWAGESEHNVQFRNDGGSRYEVKTPSGSGIARGTKFKVLVTHDNLARFIVTEGKVDVTGQNRTVSVIAGQMSSLLPSGLPDDPRFTISGEGEVNATGNTWTIAGQTFQTHESTLIIGNPQVGDLVRVDGYLLDDGSRVADRIVLLQPAVTNRFNLRGVVETIGDTWTVAGQTIVVNDETAIADGIAVGDEVQVEGLILAGGTLLAHTISSLDVASDLSFQFHGIVQAISAGSWTISGQIVTVDAETAVDEEIAIGDVVVVRGWILENGDWLATAIQQQDDELATFAFVGTVQTIDPWRVNGVAFETRAWTVVAQNINVGDRVQVRGTILSDGTWVAATITLLAEPQVNIITFVGIVGSIDPWIVNGLPLVITDATIIPGSISVGSLVSVQAQLMPDGTWTVLRLLPLYPDFGFGCFILSSPIIAVNANAIQVRHWRGEIDLANIQGEAAVNHIVTLPICTGWDGTILIIGDIIVIYQPIVIIIDDGGRPGGSRGSDKDSGSSKDS